MEKPTFPKIIKHLRTKSSTPTLPSSKDSISAPPKSTEGADVPHHLLDFLDTEAEFPIRVTNPCPQKKFPNCTGGADPLLVGGLRSLHQRRARDYRLDAPEGSGIRKAIPRIKEPELHAPLGGCLDPDTARKIHEQQKEGAPRARGCPFRREISDNLTGSRLLC